MNSKNCREYAACIEQLRSGTIIIFKLKFEFAEALKSRSLPETYLAAKHGFKRWKFDSNKSNVHERLFETSQTIAA